MKKFKMLAFGALLAVSMMFTTACGGPKEPTADDVESALKHEDYIDKDAKDSNGDKIKYNIEVKKVKLNDDKDKAKVDAKVTFTDGPVDVEQDYKITFKLKDKEDWKYKEVETDGDRKVTLKSEITDEEVDKILEYASYSLDDGNIYLYSDYITSKKVKKHDLQADDMKDIVTLEVEAEKGVMTYKFEAEVEFTFNYYGYDNYWTYDYNTIKGDDYESEFSSDYEFTVSNDDIVGALKDNDYNYFYSVGSYHYFKYCDVTDMEFEVDEPDGSNYMYGDISFKVDDGGMVFSAEGRVAFSYDTYDKKWEYDYLTDMEYEFESFDKVGKWSGTNKDGETLTVEILEDLYEDYPMATVQFASKDNGTYSWKAYLNKWSYDTYDGELDFNIDTYEWITKPTNNDSWAWFDVSGSASSDTLKVDNYNFSGDLTKN